MRILFIPALLILLVPVTGCSQGSNIPDKDGQIAAAVMAAPEDMRADATVMGYNGEGELVSLREGNNSLICVADNPGSDGFSVACYHQDLEPFMTRGRDLRAEGKSRDEIFQTREDEAKAGTLPMPEKATTLHLLEGPEGKYNPESGMVENARYRYVVYIPWATGESTGLPLKPVVQGGPWLMDPGTHRAHIMISTPAQ